MKKKIPSCKVKASLGKKFVYNLQTCRGFLSSALNDFSANSV